MHQELFRSKALELHDKLLKDQRIEPFLLPVRRALYHDYHKVIKRPTNMKLIKTHLSKKDYKLADFEEELNRMWENCFQYNKQDSPIYFHAQQLQSETKLELKAIRNSIIKKIFKNRGEYKKPSMIAILRFGNLFMDLNPHQKELVMEAVEIVNPHAIPQGLNQIWLERLSGDEIDGLIELLNI